MISVQEAKDLVVKNTFSGKEETKLLTLSLGYVLSQNIKAPFDLPSFDNSAMDGYAFRFQDFQDKKQIKIIGESSAGKSFTKKIKSNECVRIFTGAEMPAGADTVVMQEKVSVENNLLTINDLPITLGLNVRKRGSQILKGELAMKKSSLISPAAIGFLSSFGIKKIKVYSKPRVSIIVTGNELEVAGNKLSRGKIYESNSSCLNAGLEKSGISKSKIYRVKDDEKKISQFFSKALSESNFILLTGGISVGDYDFVGKVLQQLKVKTIFYKVKQRPGKPFYFGVKNKKAIFALPGNPASVLSCFYQYVLPAIKKFQGMQDLFLPAVQLPLAKPIKKLSTLGFFLKAKTDFKTVQALEGQFSHIMKSFADANCMIYVPEGIDQLDAGATVEVHLLL
ncbi:MAG: molybdopterin molybdotransferase MoeA [Chitinophagales bacterium]|nr:molybdopterin molybdotransferase MoeA [Chitinophagales bacterium]